MADEISFKSSIVPNLPRTHPLQQDWLICWDGRSMHAKAIATEHDIDALAERLEALRGLLRARGIVPVQATGRILKPDDEGYLTPELRQNFESPSQLRPRDERGRKPD